MPPPKENLIIFSSPEVIHKNPFDQITTFWYTFPPQKNDKK